MNPLSIRPAMAPAQAQPPAPNPLVSTAPPVWRHVAQGAWITLGAFSLPTALSPLFKNLLTPRAFALRTLLGGFIYIDMIQPPLQVRFAPPPSIGQEAAALTLGMAPYIATFHVQAVLTNGWCSRPGSAGARISAASQRGWQQLCGLMPGSMAADARKYPINFVLARFAAQMAAVVAGSMLTLAYHRMRGSRLVKRPKPLPSRPLRERLQSRPDAYAVGAAPFVVPALLDSRYGRALLQAPRLPRALCGVAITSALVGAALVTAVNGAEKRQ